MMVSPGVIIVAAIVLAVTGIIAFFRFYVPWSGQHSNPNEAMLQFLEYATEAKNSIVISCHSLNLKEIHLARALQFAGLLEKKSGQGVQVTIITPTKPEWPFPYSQRTNQIEWVLHRPGLLGWMIDSKIVEIHFEPIFPYSGHFTRCKRLNPKLADEILDSMLFF